MLFAFEEKVSLLFLQHTAHDNVDGVRLAWGELFVELLTAFDFWGNVTHKKIFCIESLHRTYFMLCLMMMLLCARSR